MDRKRLTDGENGHLGSGTKLANFARTVSNAMPQQKASDRMNELIHSLQQAMGRLEAGKLSLPELERSTDDARAIFERLVVLRHKAREAAVSAGKQVAASEPTTSPPTTVAPEDAKEEESAPIRLDTRPPEVTAQQTSLIDAIAETENSTEEKPSPVGPNPPAQASSVPPAPAAPKPPKAKPAAAKEPAERPLTVADKMEHAPVADLRKAIALSQKFWFVAELFGGDRKRYEEAIDALNAMNNLAEAQAYMHREVTSKQPKPPGEEVAATFMDLLQRRFS
ncbi:MAG: hypothetical protein KDC01_11480 [Flavobacteriales bacterium]|nr:hypothetical protein [Flavobacteriales bacterium]